MTFSKLAPFIQEYIYHHNWTELRPVQLAASDVIFNTDAHLLIAAATAAGKTEAAFLPVLTLLHEKPANTIGVLYIGPIKALINDQFERLNDLLKTADIPVWHWHGDVAQSRKNKLIKNPQGILQITPESLESLLINKNNDLMRLFGDLRFVIIDEIHSFMGSERGCQIICQLQRLANLTKTQPRRIGLSATLGNYAMAEEWLRSGTDKSVITPDITAEKRQIKLAVEHFYLESEIDESEATAYEKYIFNLSKSRKCLIFANNRTQTESVIASLRRIAKAQALPDIYHVHHGSISASLRQAAENAIREPDNPAVTAATLTLELGIDIGHLERVIQLESPLSVASFLQRLGRSGRRGEAADMRLICGENQPLSEAPLPEQIPWQLLQCIAIIQLYLEERWIEPIEPIKYPLSLLYHQTMSILAATGEITPAALAKQILNLSPFAAISSADFKSLLHYLIDIDHIHKTEQGKLIIGLAGEKIVGKFQFYAVFADIQEYAVKQGTTEIGSIAIPTPVGNQFALAGRTWEVLEVDFKKKVILVKQVAGKATIYWRGGSGSIHTRVLQRMRQVLLEDLEYSYLQKNAQERLKLVRQIIRNAGLDKQNILQLEKGKCCIFPWMGTVAYRTLERLLNSFCRESLEINSIGGVNPYYLTIKLGKDKFKLLQTELVSLCEQRITAEHLVSSAEAPELQKYDQFIPHSLLRKAFTEDYLDIIEVKKQILLW
ncbi:MULTISPECIES: DEAD/DEAH box helicase [unclassified Nodularia (in: cyanobacteria)]|uniref:DEAD/DEAH box helicase n=1 Tax=unclassified Nodularia (in: cyanobacteria) TaxID=2656917 RepID=UPI0018803EC0|nr:MULTISPECIES: DEAD/DEAH box helicase [unclassified Nodularia (in: cyanobacteria)]MBE9199366.1 DEAD/DEAH box helicase [Nodularia sp. LEGE 06071]MCC2695100.1 DEAD/DEAH box helicase [Nodularia sp. LEGE 04288]